MLFRKPVEQLCQLCRHSTELSDNQVLCAKRGVVSMYYHCRKFRYDPCKRIPPRPKALDFDKYSQEDFSL